MALSQKATGPRWIILESDPAILPGSDYPAYRESLYTNESKLVLDPTNPPSKFLIEQWRDPHKTAVEVAVCSRERIKMGVRCGLKSARNYHVEAKDGSLITDHVPSMKLHGKLGEIIDEEWMDRFNDDRGIGDVVLADLFLAIDYLSSAKRPLSRPSSTRSDSGESSATAESIGS